MKRLRELGERYGLSAGAVRQLDALLRLLEHDPEAPSSVSTPAEAVDVHIADSLAVLDLPEVLDSETVVDIGAGAGYPGLVLAIARPEAHVDLLEATSRKCRFLERVIETAEVENARVVCARAEAHARNGAEGAGCYELATARAVGSLPLLVEYASPLLRTGGFLIAWRGRRNPQDENAGAAAAGMLGMSPTAVVPVTPFEGAANRHLHVFRKIADTPPGFPRRPGLARKRPLGGDRGD